MRWSQRNGRQRLESYFIASAHALIVLVIFIVILPTWSHLQWPLRVVYALAGVGLAALALPLVARTLRSFGHASAPIAPGPMWAMLFLSAGLALMSLAVPLEVGSDTALTRSVLVVLAPVISLTVLSPVLPIRALWIATIAVCALVPVVAIGVGGFEPQMARASVAVVIFVVATVGTVRSTAWMMGVIGELDRTRHAAAQLAVAQERLRFSRDLHDVVGQSMSAMALKTQVAAELVRRHDDRALTELAGIESIAQKSLRQMREMVSGYRRADLSTELEGAAALLNSAGIRTEITMDDEVPAPAHTPLAWVIREGSTNIVRHSAASAAVISVSRQGPYAVVTMTNDAPHPQRQGGDGHGLIGLHERLAGLGGGLTTRHTATSFTVTARVPVGGGK